MTRLGFSPSSRTRRTASIRMCSVQKTAPGGSPPRTLRWAGARSRRGRADVSSATRNTRYACGCTITRSGCSGCRWSVGSRPPMFPRAGCWFPACIIVSQQQWDWCPPLVVADMGYLGAAAKQQCRERWRVAVLTKLRSDMKLVPPYVAWDQAACPQGEPLTWLGYDGPAGEHWFGVGAEPELCRCCWEAVRCPRQFAYPPAQHETLLGRLPLASRLAQQVLQQVRPWIEPAQSFEKNQLGLGDVFFNSLRFTWTMALLADAAVL